VSQNQAQWCTLILCVAATAQILGFDAIWIRLYGLDASISRVVGRLLERYPSALLALVFWLGLVVGHVWLPAR
jgi:hypothetical protein